MTAPRMLRSQRGVARLACAWLIAIAVESLPQAAAALPAYSRLYQARYGYRVSCELCHTAGGGSAINDYGRDFLRAGANLGAFAKVEGRDSDGDEGPNLDEIRARANPGDARSRADAPGGWLGRAEQPFVPTEQLRKLFPSADSFAAIEGTLKDAQIRAVEARLGVRLTDEDRVPTFYFAIRGGRRFAVVQYVSAPSPKGPLSIAVAMDAGGSVTRVSVLKNPAGKAVESPAFLTQFSARKLGDPIQVGKDLKPAAGAEALSREVALAVAKSVASINAVFGKRAVAGAAGG